MKKQNLLTVLILVMTIPFGMGKAFADAEAEQTGTLSVPPTISIIKESTSEAGSINPRTGINTGNLTAVFALNTNVYDDTYNFLICSKIESAGDSVISGYTNNGELIFTNVSNPPTIEAIEDVKQGGNNNPNVIAYGVDYTIPETMSISYDPSKKTNEGTGCYVLLVNNTSEGRIIQNVKSNPVDNSYSLADQAGTYKATVYFTAVAK